MGHYGLMSLDIDIKGIKDISTVTKTDDHELKDYTPFIEILKWGSFTPQDMKVIQAEKGMIILGSGCDDCPCSEKITYSEGRVNTGKKVITKLYVTPIDEAKEKASMTKWVKELKAKLNKEEEGHTHS